MNPFNEKSKPIEKSFQNWQQLYPESYDKFEIDPYTKTRIILMNGTEFEANWFSHQFSRHTGRTGGTAGRQIHGDYARAADNRAPQVSQG